MKTKEWFNEVVDRVYRACDAWVEGTVLSSPRLWMLHQRFREVRAKLDRKREHGRLYFVKRQPWTGVANPDHRRALGRLVASNHRLAVEVLRRGDGQRRRPVPREWRLCRFCRTCVEDEVHALLVCNESRSLVALRASFWSDLEAREVSWRVMRETGQGFFILHTLLSSERACARFGQYVSDVFSLFDESAMFVPARALYEGSHNEVDDSIDDDGTDDDDVAEGEDAQDLWDQDDYVALAGRGFG
ncbi:hypothetical protein BDZ89DRAFT_187066 [Hymenopellis radicata]|nr:hypothetical protein BDZ89DRAFT_187066 [Hymenopellis radicata]